MDSDHTQVPALSDWSVESLRIIFFPHGEIGDHKDWWWSAVGNEPNQSTERKGGIFSQDGEFGHGSLALNGQQGIIDWTYTAFDNEVMPHPEANKFDTRMQFVESLDTLLGSIQLWLGEAPPVKRIAVTGVILVSAPKQTDAVSMLGEIAPGLTLPPDASDVVLRFNQSQVSNIIPNLAINRLVTWSTATLVRSKLTLSPTGVSEQRPGLSGYCCQVAFDVNTSGDRLEPIPEQDLHLILMELRNVAVALVEGSTSNEN